MRKNSRHDGHACTHTTQDTPEPHHRRQPRTPRTPRKPEDRDMSQFQSDPSRHVRDVHVNTLLQLSCAPRRPDYNKIETAE